MIEIDMVEPGLDGRANGAVRVVCGGEQEDAFMVQLSLEGDDVAGLGTMVPLTPTAARRVARHLVEAAAAAESNDFTGDGNAFLPAAHLGAMLSAVQVAQPFQKRTSIDIATDLLAMLAAQGWRLIHD